MEAAEKGIRSRITMGGWTVAWIGAIGVLLVALGAMLIGSTPTDAYHSSGTHIGTMHIAHFYNDEDYCALVLDGSMSHSTLYNRVRNTLYIDNPSEDWDGLANDKVWFISGYYGPCNEAPYRAGIQIEYWAQSSGCGGLNCAWKTNPYWNPSKGHTDYLYGYVLFKTSHVTGSTAFYRHVINHETGHILGLADPSPGYCLTSVMHSVYYGCSSNLEWPSSGDRNAVTIIAD